MHTHERNISKLFQRNIFVLPFHLFRRKTTSNNTPSYEASFTVKVVVHFHASTFFNESAKLNSNNLRITRVKLSTEVVFKNRLTPPPEMLMKYSKVFDVTTRSQRRYIPPLSIHSTTFQDRTNSTTSYIRASCDVNQDYSLSTNYARVAGKPVERMVKKLHQRGKLFFSFFRHLLHTYILARCIHTYNIFLSCFNSPFPFSNHHH